MYHIKVHFNFFHGRNILKAHVAEKKMHLKKFSISLIQLRSFCHPVRRDAKFLWKGIDVAEKELLG